MGSIEFNVYAAGPILAPVDVSINASKAGFYGLTLIPIADKLCGLQN